MAVKRVNFFSDCLRRRVEYHVALPKAYLPVEEDGEGRQGVAHTYVEDEGAHDFNFWNTRLEPAICAMLKGVSV